MKINRVLKEWRNYLIKKLTGRRYDIITNRTTENEITSGTSYTSVFEGIFTSDKNLRNVFRFKNDDIEMLLKSDHSNSDLTLIKEKQMRIDRESISLTNQKIDDCQVKTEAGAISLNYYLAHKSSKIRRNAICKKILKLDKENPLLDYMIFLLREEHIRDYLM